MKKTSEKAIRRRFPAQNLHQSMAKFGVFCLYPISSRRTKRLTIHDTTTTH